MKQRDPHSIATPATTVNVDGARPRYVNPFRLFIGSFTPQWLERIPSSSVSFGAKHCYARLCRYASKETGIASPTHEQLAVALGTSERTIRKYLRKLAEQGFIESRRRGLKRANEYRFLNHPAMNSFRRGASDQERNPCSDQEQNTLSVLSYKENQKRESEGERKLLHFPREK